MSSVIATLEAVAREGSTYVLTASFVDEDSQAVVPNSATWSLYDRSGSIVNEREDVVISPLSSTVTVVLSGDDLVAGELTFHLSWTYDSDAGTGNPGKDEVKLNVANLKGV